MSRPRLRVVKVGGSLFDLPDLGARLRRWLGRQSPAVNVLVAGGGELADVIRRADERHHLGEPTSHWLCVELLGPTAGWLAAIGDWPLVDSLSAVEEAGVGDNRAVADLPPVVVFDPRRFLRNVESTLPGDSLPHTWQTTSDSISARLATAMDAEELVLLKSRPPPRHGSLAELANMGYVDPFFPVAAGAVRLVRCVDLRGDPVTV